MKNRGIRQPDVTNIRLSSSRNPYARDYRSLLRITATQPAKSPPPTIVKLIDKISSNLVVAGKP